MPEPPISPAEVEHEIERLRLSVIKGKEHHVHLSFLPSLLLTAKYVHVNAVRDKRRTLIGVATVFIVVTFTAVLYNAVLRSPLIFLRVAESQVGEMDMLITPQVMKYDALLDMDKAQDAVSKFEFFNATAFDREHEHQGQLLPSP